MLLHDVHAGAEMRLIVQIHTFLRVSAVSPADELIEAVELPERSFVLGVQWHPEADAASPVIGGLVQAAEQHARGRVLSG